MRPRMLVAYSMESAFAQTTRDYLLSLKDYTGYEVEYVHVTHGANLEVDLDRYDIVFQSYCARFRYENYLSESYRGKLRRFKGVKILSLQDEGEHTNRTRAAIKDYGFDIVLTLMRPETVDYAYPRTEFPGVAFVFVITGYVHDGLMASLPAPLPLEERPIVVGYRGRDLGAHYGRLGLEKVEIGRRMKEICDARGIANDIASDEASRIYGMAWFDFIGRCRSMLGSESASNVFDFDGSIEAKFKEMTAANGGRRPSYDEFRPFTEQREREVDNAMVSPRIFECAMMRTPMVLFRGRYSDCVEPGTHYIPLEKDFSNVDEVLRRLEDIPALEAMAERAHADLVASGKFSYRTFGAKIREACDRRLAAKGWRRNDRAPIKRRPAALRAADRRRAILTEPPTPEPKSREQLETKQLRAARIDVFEQNKALAGSLDWRVARCLSALNAQYALLRDIDRRFDGTASAMPSKHMAQAAFLRELDERRQAGIAALRAHDQTVGALAARLGSPHLIAGENEHLAAEGQLQDEYGRWIPQVVGFLTLYDDVLTLNGIVVDRIDDLRDCAGLLVANFLRARAFFALWKAPWRTLVKTYLRRFRNVGTSAA